ncbi:Pycsar system effector family protein [Streptomyces sp. NPDC051684]|uniref:Pycsar system effector family protein n=1 Tax=Streptomyces sp. NPDC051684 TaxID=3365670 RepID=UPI00379906EA
MTPAPAPEDPRLQAGVQLLTDLRAEIARADTKAAVLVGALGIAAGGMSTLLTDHPWTPGALGPSATLLRWSGAIMLVAALLCLLLAVMPRYGKSWSPGQPLTYFGDVHHAVRTAQLTTALADTGHDPAHGLLLSLAETSRIATRKHFWIRAGVAVFACAAVLLTGSLLFA